MELIVLALNLTEWNWKVWVPHSETLRIRNFFPVTWVQVHVPLQTVKRCFISDRVWKENLNHIGARNFWKVWELFSKSDRLAIGRSTSIVCVGELYPGVQKQKIFFDKTTFLSLLVSWSRKGNKSFLFCPNTWLFPTLHFSYDTRTE